MKDTKPTATREKLIGAALAEFNLHGFDGTNSNKIARTAGFAPQTFYRNFADKRSVFIAAYELWQREEWAELDVSSFLNGRPVKDMAETLLAFHARYRVFRLSLVKLAAEHTEIAEARAKSRLQQIDRAVVGGSALGNDRVKILAAILATETILDAVVAGIFDAYSTSSEETLQLVIDSVAPLVPEGPQA